MPTTISGTNGVDNIASGAVQSVDFAATAQLPLGNTNYSMVRLHTTNGYGSTNTCILRWTTTVTNQGTDITYADSATLGSTFTINTSGVYALSCLFRTAVTSSVVGFSLNSSQLSTSVASIAIADRLAVSQAFSVNAFFSTSASLYLPAGSVIRTHADANAPQSTDCGVIIVRVA
jgi:hypothetical protein